MWKCLFEKGIYFVQDLLNRDCKFLSLENIQRKYNVQLNYLKYFQLIAAIQSYLKRKAQATAATNRNIFEGWDTFYLFENQVISLTNLSLAQSLDPPLVIIYFIRNCIIG